MTRADLNDPFFPLEVLARRSPDPLSRSTMALILAGGRGSRLGELTDWRAKPSIPFGGKFRIIDFALSNCVNSGIRRIGICTQYKAQSLIRHVQRGWSFFDGRFAEFVELVVSEELDELFEVCDRLHVIARGKLSPSVPLAEATVEKIGEWMSGLWEDAAEVQHGAA